MLFLLPASGEKVPNGRMRGERGNESGAQLSHLRSPLTRPRIKYGAGSSGTLSPQAGRGT